MTDTESDIDYCIGEVAAHLGADLSQNARENMVKRLAPKAGVGLFRVLWGLVETHKGRPFPNPMEIENMVKMRSNHEPKGLPPLPKRLPLTTHEVQTEAGELAKKYAGDILATLKPAKTSGTPAADQRAPAELPDFDEDPVDLGTF